MNVILFIIIIVIYFMIFIIISEAITSFINMPYLFMPFFYDN
jgi:hypothetical protein